jgi:hypothetical protein
MLLEPERAPRECVEVRSRELEAAVGAEHVAIEAIEKNDDRVFRMPWFVGSHHASLADTATSGVGARIGRHGRHGSLSSYADIHGMLMLRFTTRLAVGLLAVGLLAITISACAIAKPPIQETSQVVATPVQGELTVAAIKAPTVGEVTPVKVSVANGTDITRSVIPSQIFAISSSGQRVAPLPPGEAARQAGNAGELKAAITSGAVSGVAGGALGAGLGAAVGAVTGGIGPGAIIGAATGAGWGMFEGASRGQDRSDSQANAQLNSLALPQEDVAHNFTVSGYVFFPKGDYQQLQVLMINRETGDTEEVTRPWP